MFISFNGIILNTDNVISFHEGTVDKQGKYPIYADHVMQESTDEIIYKEIYNLQDSQS